MTLKIFKKKKKGNTNRKQVNNINGKQSRIETENIIKQGQKMHFKVTKDPVC